MLRLRDLLNVMDDDEYVIIDDASRRITDMLIFEGLVEYAKCCPFTEEYVIILARSEDGMRICINTKKRQEK